MADVYGPFDSSTWAEADWYRSMTQALHSGVHGGTPATSTTTGYFAWQAVGLTITLAAGRANVGGAGYVRSATLTSVTTTANTHATFNRRDRIVARRSLATHNVTLVVITGTPSSSPEPAPAITRDDTYYDLPVFSFLVPPNSGTAIATVYDERIWVGNDGALQVASSSVTSNLGNLGVLPAGYRVRDSVGWIEWTGSAWSRGLSLGNSGTVTGLIAPTVASDAATKGYVDLLGYLGFSNGGDRVITAGATCATVNVTIPAGLTTGTRIKVYGRAYCITGTGVGVNVSIGGTTRSINAGSLSGDVGVTIYDTDLTAGARSYGLIVSPTVASGSITIKSAEIFVEVV